MPWRRLGLYGAAVQRDQAAHDGQPKAALLVFIMVMAIIRLVMFRRYGWMGRCCGHSGYHDSRFEAEALLRRRLVNGEIKEEEYQRLKEILSK